MRTIAFYSYKGGVGRTLAVAHFAYWLGKQGQSVFLLDMDLEAPGMHYKIVKYTKPVHPELGLVDYIGHFQRENKAAESLEPYTIRLVSRDVGMPPVWLMPAGNPLNPNYWSQLSKVEWKEFLYGGQKSGSLLFLELKAHIEAAYQPDFLLIDSRTGLTDLTGIGLELLADDAIVLGVNNPENIDGTRLVMERLRRREKLPVREEKTRLHFVLARIPAPERQSDLDREEKLKEAILQQMNSGTYPGTGPLVTKVNVIHIDPEQAWEERIRFMERQEDWGKYPILKDYQDLVYEVTGLGESGNGVSFWYLHANYLFEGDIDKKKELAKQLVAMESDVAEQEFHRGYIAQEFLRDLDSATKAYSNAIKLRPDNEMAYNNRGGAYAVQEQYDLALADFAKAIELKPDLAVAYGNRGLAYADQELYDLALACYDKAIEIEPDYANAYNNRGNIHARQAHYDLALADFTKAIELKPDNAGAYNNRANTYCQLGKHFEALRDAEQSLALDPTEPTTFGTMAEIHSAMGHIDEFYEFLDKCLALDASKFDSLAPQTLARHQHEPRFQELVAKYKQS